MNKILHLLKITSEVLLVIGFIFFEELVWKKLALPVKNWLASLKVLEKVQENIMKLDVYPTLAVFLVPLAIAEFMGIKSGALIITGELFWGVVVYALKIPVAGLTFWVFSFSREKLLSIDWFNTLYELLMRFLDWVKSLKIYKSVKVKIRWAKIKVKKLSPKNGGLSTEMKKVYEAMAHVFKEDRDSNGAHK